MGYNLITVSDYYIRYYDSYNTVEYPLIDDTFVEGVLKDKASFLYVLNKITNKISSKEKILIRFINKNNIVRIFDLPNLSKEEVKSYFNFNKENIVPFNINDIELDYSYNNNILTVGGISKEFVNIVRQATTGYTNTFLTTFPLEVISNIKVFNYKNYIYFNFESNLIEYVFIVNEKFNNYKYIELDIKIDPHSFDVLDVKNSKVIYRIKELINKIISDYEKLNLCTYEMFSIGDRNIYGIIRQIVPNSEIKYKEFDIYSYFR